MPEYTSGSSIRAERTPPRKSTSRKQMVDFRGFPLSSEDGNPLTTEKESYPKSEYGQENAPSVVLNSDSYLKEGISSQNKFSKGRPAALPIEERFSDTSVVSRSLLGINRETTQQGLFGNVSTYGLDEKDWRVDGTGQRDPRFWYARPSFAGNYYETRFTEDTVNSALAISVYPSPFTPPGKPSLQDQLLNPGGASRYSGWGQYLNSIIAQYLVEYMVKTFDAKKRTEFNLDYFLSKYAPIEDSTTPSGLRFNQLQWDKIWLDIKQTRFGALTDYPLIPSGRAYNFVTTETNPMLLTPFKSASLWGEGGNSSVIITESDAAVPNTLSAAWDSYFFGTTRVFYPSGLSSDQGHYRIRTNPTPDLWRKYFGLDWDYLRQDLKDWNFTVHESTSTLTNVETELKLPYFILDSPIEPDPTNIFSSSWPSESFGEAINLPTNENKIGGSPGVNSTISMKSIRAFRYQPGRISGFTYGSKASEMGAGPGTTIEWGIENDTDAYFFRLADGADFQIVRRSIIPFEENDFFEEAGYLGDATTEVFRNGNRQFETIIEQKNMNGDSLNGEGESGYILDPDTVTMYKIEFGWYGAIGARFYAYVPAENDQCRWVVLHTLVIENQLGEPCLGDPFFYFRYRLSVSDSSTIRLNQFLYKFGASYYIDGYDKGTLYSSFAKSKERKLNDPKFTNSKTYLNAIDYTVMMGVKPKQYLYNRYGSEIYNKKEIFPKSFSIYSKENAEIKIIRQKACPEFAYMHQEGYNWPALPTSRRMRSKFSVNNFNTNDSALGILTTDATTHTATLAKSANVSGYRDFADSTNWSVIRDDCKRISGTDLFNLAIVQKDLDLANGNFKLNRIEGGGYTSSVDYNIEKENVYLPFTYAAVGDFSEGYEVELDYFRRDQTLLSTIDVISDEFYIFWVGGDRGSGVSGGSHAATMKIGFAWPDTANSSSLIHTSRSKSDWGIEMPADPAKSAPAATNRDDADAVGYDGEKFYEGLPVDLTEDYKDNCLFIETNTSLGINTYNLETSQFSNADDAWDFNISVPGSEGGECHAIGCKAGREVKEATVKNYPIDIDGVSTNQYFLQSLEPWPTIGDGYQVSVQDGSNIATISVGTPTTRQAGGAVVYLLLIGSSLAPLTGAGVVSSEVEVSYNLIYIATVDKKNRTTGFLASAIAPGNIPFIRVFMQGRQGCNMGGMWIGQKTPRGIIVDPFTPHRSTVNIKDSGDELHGSSFGVPETDGAIKAITTRTQLDLYGRSTAPTDDFSVNSLDTYKSVHTSPKKCGSFLSRGGTDSAGILSPSDYPIRWLTNNSSGLPLATYYVPKDQSVEISLEDIFNVDAESIINSDDANLATLFIARSLNSHTPADSEKEIYMTLNYDEQ